MSTETQEVAVLSRDLFVRYLHGEVSRYDSHKDAAYAWGLSESYLSDILRDRRKPGAKLLVALGFERIEGYRRSKI